MVFEKILCKMGKNWIFSKNIGLGLNCTYEFEVRYYSLHPTVSPFFPHTLPLLVPFYSHQFKLVDILSNLSETVLCGGLTPDIYDEHADCRDVEVEYCRYHLQQGEEGWGGGLTLKGTLAANSVIQTSSLFCLSPPNWKWCQPKTGTTLGRLLPTLDRSSVALLFCCSFSKGKQSYYVLFWFFWIYKSYVITRLGVAGCSTNSIVI